MNTASILAILAGAGIGLGLFLVVREFVPGVPALGPALRQLQAPGAVDRPPSAGPLAAIGTWLRVPHRELALVGHSPERYVIEKIGFTLLGLLFPTVFSLILALSGVWLGPATPAIAGVALAALFFVLVDVSVSLSGAPSRVEVDHVGG
jgi:tight adherence protein C